MFPEFRLKFALYFTTGQTEIATFRTLRILHKALNFLSIHLLTAFHPIYPLALSNRHWICEITGLINLRKDQLGSNGLDSNDSPSTGHQLILALFPLSWPLGEDNFLLPSLKGCFWNTSRLFGT